MAVLPQAKNLSREVAMPAGFGKAGTIVLRL